MDDESRQEWFQQLEDRARRNQGASGRAIASLVLGILSLIGCWFLAGIPALILAYGELKAIDAGESSPAGRGFAKAGQIMGWISIGLTVIVVIIGILRSLG